jgi:hypothetical protein
MSTLSATAKAIVIETEAWIVLGSSLATAP